MDLFRWKWMVRKLGTTCKVQCKAYKRICCCIRNQKETKILSVAESFHKYKSSARNLT